MALAALRVAALTLAISPFVSAQQRVYVVDAAGGPGSHFTDIQQAVDAVPDGAAIVVRPGSYAGFVIDGKGLTIDGADKNTVNITSVGITISNTNAKQQVLLRDLTVNNTSFSGSFILTAVSIADTAGPVCVDNVDITSLWGWLSSTSIDVQRAAHAHFHRCKVSSTAYVMCLTAVDSVLQLSHCDFGFAPVTTARGEDAVHITRTRCLAFASTISGQNGNLGCSGWCFGGSGTPGGHGVVADDRSWFYAYGTTVQGGRGGSTSGYYYWYGGYAGGDGIVLSNNSHAAFEGSEPSGSAGGGGGPAGAPFTRCSGCTIRIDKGSQPSTGDVTGVATRGNTIQFKLDAVPGSGAVLLLAYDGAVRRLEPLIQNSVLATPVLALPVGVVPPSGTTLVPFPVPSNFPRANVFHGQFATVEPLTYRIWTTNTFPLSVNG